MEALPERQGAIAPEDSRAGKHKRFGLGFKPKVAPPFLVDTELYGALRLAKKKATQASCSTAQE